MKFTVAFLAISMCFISLIHALPNERHKRAVALEKCPMDVSCEDYVKDRIKQFNYCTGYSVHGDAVEWQSCGVISCGGDSKLGKEDLSKPYPDCCAQCEIN